MKKQNDSSITMTLLKDIVALDLAQQANLPKFENQPQKPADLMHDAGNGYNSGFTFPQQ